MTVRPYPNMGQHETNELFFDNLEIPAENLIGEEGKAFKYILDGLKRRAHTLIAAECIGDWLLVHRRGRRSTPARAVVFERRSGRTRGCRSDCRGLHRGRGGQPDALPRLRTVRCAPACGAEANMAKHLAAKRRGRPATSACRRTAGFGFACEYDVERKFRGDALYLVAPISTNLVFSYVAEHVLGMPRSF